MGLTRLREAIEKLDDPDAFTPDELVEGFALRDQLDARLSAAVGSFDRDEQAALVGATSTTAWLKDRCRMSGADAGRTTSTARKLRALPHLAQAWRDGALSSAHVRAVCANVPDRHLEKFAAIEAEMVPAFGSLSVRDTTEVMQQWLRAADDADPKDKPDEPDDVLRGVGDP